MSQKTYYTRSCRVLPTYLLWRSNSESTIDSDGASRIFAPSETTTSAKDTCSTSNVDDLSSISSKNTSVTHDDTYSVSNSSTSRLTINDAASDVYSWNNQSSTIQSTQRMLSGSSSELSTQTTINADEHVDNVKGNVVSAIWCLAACSNSANNYLGSNNQPEDMWRNNNDYISFNNHTSYGDMVEPYIPCATDATEDYGESGLSS